MGLFETRNPFHFINVLLGKEPSIIDKMDMLITDVEIEGKKQGYTRAAKEFEEAFRSIEEKYKQTIAFLQSQKDFYNYKANEFIDILEQLEKQEEKLKKQINDKIREASHKFNIPKSELEKSLEAGTLLTSGNKACLDFLDLIYNYKSDKLHEAEKKGYEEAKEIFVSKIQNLKGEYQKLKK